jgi:hypothetical protein
VVTLTVSRQPQTVYLPIAVQLWDDLSIATDGAFYVYLEDKVDMLGF